MVENIQLDKVFRSETLPDQIREAFQGFGITVEYQTTSVRGRQLVFTLPGSGKFHVTPEKTPSGRMAFYSESCK